MVWVSASQTASPRTAVPLHGIFFWMQIMTSVCSAMNWWVYQCFHGKQCVLGCTIFVPMDFNERSHLGLHMAPPPRHPRHPSRPFPSLWPQIRTGDKSIRSFAETQIPAAFFSSREQRVNGSKTSKLCSTIFFYFFICVNDGFKVNVNNLEARISRSLQTFKLVARVFGAGCNFLPKEGGSRLHIISNRRQDYHFAWKELPTYLGV